MKAISSGDSPSVEKTNLKSGELTAFTRLSKRGFSGCGGGSDFLGEDCAGVDWAFAAGAGVPRREVSCWGAGCFSVRFASSALDASALDATVAFVGLGLGDDRLPERLARLARFTEESLLAQLAEEGRAGPSETAGRFAVSSLLACRRIGWELDWTGCADGRVWGGWAPWPDPAAPFG